jgi:hypothetical protein
MANASIDAKIELSAVENTALMAKMSIVGRMPETSKATLSHR